MQPLPCPHSSPPRPDGRPPLSFGVYCMIRIRLMLGVALLSVTSLALPMAATPAGAATIDNNDPSRFIETLSGEAFRLLHIGSKASARGQFRQLLGQYFA